MFISSVGRRIRAACLGRLDAHIAPRLRDSPRPPHSLCRRQEFRRSLPVHHLPLNASPLWPVCTPKKASPRGMGTPFDGRRTSNGEVYDMHQFTAAHRTLPFGAVLRVTNLSNGMQTQVRINDRGPFVANRVIDLSLSAAQAIGMVGPGTAHVRIEMISGPNPQLGFFGVQVGAFSVEANAEKLRAQLSSALFVGQHRGLQLAEWQFLPSSRGPRADRVSRGPACRAIASGTIYHFRRSAR